MDRFIAWRNNCRASSKLHPLVLTTQLFVYFVHIHSFRTVWESRAGVDGGLLVDRGNVGGESNEVDVPRVRWMGTQSPCE